MADRMPNPPGYDDLLGALVERIRTAQLRASDAVNRELVGLYWSIGREILIRQDVEGRGLGSSSGWRSIFEGCSPIPVGS